MFKVGFRHADSWFLDLSTGRARLRTGYFVPELTCYIYGGCLLMRNARLLMRNLHGFWCLLMRGQLFREPGFCTGWEGSVSGSVAGLLNSAGSAAA